jgi:hypothetical protein
MNIEKLLYLPLDLPAPSREVIKELDKIPYEEMSIDHYRTCYHIPIMRGNKTSMKYEWVSHLTSLHEYLEEHIFPWSQRARVVIITTKPGDLNAPHIDCSPKNFNTLQHKFRYVLQGNVSDLEFITKEKNLRVHEVDQPFIISGKWPHSMLNTTNKRKYTLALGSPWEPTLTDKKYISLLERSYNKFKDYYIAVDNLSLPDNYEELYEEKYYSY